MKYIELKLNREENFQLNESVDSRFMFGRLSESEIFDLANKATKVGGKKLSDVLPLILKDGAGFMHLGTQDFSSDLKYELFESSKFNRKKVQNRKKVLEAIEKGWIVPVITTEQYKIPTSIPFIIKDGRPVVLYVNITDYINLDKYNKAQIGSPRDLNNLMAILYTSYLAVRMLNNQKMYSSEEIGILARTYGTMFAATIKTAASHLDMNTRLKMEYIGSKFFCIQLLGTEKGEEVFFRTISPQYERALDTMSITSIENKIKVDDYDSLSHLVGTAIPEGYPGIKINFGSFFDAWVSKFGPVTAMCMDYVGYMLYVMCLYYFEAPMLNRHALSNIISDRNLNDFFKNLVTL